MNKYWVIFLLIGGLCLGFLVGRRVYFVDVAKLEESIRSQYQSNAEGLRQVCDKEMVDFKNKFKDITPEQIKDYLKTQSAAEKLKKADEILAQVMKIFIAQLGLQLSAEDMNQFGKELPTDSPQGQRTQPAAPVATERVKDAEDRHLETRLSSRRQEVRNAGGAVRFAKLLGDNYSERIADSVILKPEQIRQLIGVYEGEIRLDDKKDGNKSVLRAEMEFNGRVEKNRYIEGSFSLKIYDSDGKLINSTTGSGNISKNLSGNENEIFIQAGRYYLQLSYFPLGESWGGNYLESDKNKYSKLGSVYLRKR